MTKIAIYCRLSEEDKHKQLSSDDSASIQNQKTMLLQYALQQNWEVYGIYSDDDYTGSDRRRPEFNRLLMDAKERKFDIILCKTQSRFTRELELVEKYIHGLFPIWGIRFISVVDNADTANKGNKKSRQINGLVNEWYLEDMSENIRSVLTSRRKNGYHIGSFALYGYKKDPEQKGHLIIDEKAAKVVREVFTLFSQGYGKTAIARMLNDRGIPNPTEYKRRQGLRYKQPTAKNSTLWKYSAISDMLKNEIYIGNMVQGRYGSVSYKAKQSKPRPKSEWYVVEDTHEPIIGRELWERVQEMLKQRTKPFGDGRKGIFAEKAKCADCGGGLRSSISHGKHYLQCANRYVAKGSCGGAFISVEKLERLVVNELNRLVDEYLDKEELTRSIEPFEDFQEEKERLICDITVYRRKSDEYSKYIREIYIDKIKGLVEENDYIRMSREFSAERKRLEKLIAESEKDLAEIEERAVSGQCGVIEQYLHIDRLTREVVEIMIDHISVGRRIPGTRDVPVEIYWNF